MPIAQYSVNTNLSLKNQVYEILKNDIIFGRLQAGEQLIMLDLCKRLNISSAPIREALNMLSQDGLVNLTPHKRATVAAIQAGDIDTIIFLRSTLEPYAAQLSVDKIPPSKISEMRVRLKAVLDNPSDVEQYVSSDLALHELLHQYAGSPLLSEIVSKVKDRSLRLRYVAEQFTSESSDTHVTITSTQEHLGILDALEAGDGALAYQRVHQHILNFSIRTHQVNKAFPDASPL